MCEWGVTALRIPLRDSRWLCEEPYRDIVDGLIYRAVERAMVVIIDLHTQQQDEGQSPFMRRGDPGLDALSFWAMIAARYADIPVIMYE
eukprot:26627-Eustigmatos_ZCMA.PRE.1